MQGPNAELYFVPDTPNYYWSLYDKSVLPEALKDGNLKSCPEHLIRRPPPPLTQKVAGPSVPEPCGAKS